VLTAKAHGNKLKTGHLAGNRFRIRVRGAAPGAGARARAVGEALARPRCPTCSARSASAAGERTWRWAAPWSWAETTAARPRRRDRFLRRLAVSAYQSWLFNRVLAERLRDGAFGSALAGDLMKKLATGGCSPASRPRPTARGWRPSRSRRPARCSATA
jgi:tRNA pseudouridine13 synthase